MSLPFLYSLMAELPLQNSDRQDPAGKHPDYCPLPNLLPFSMLWPFSTSALPGGHLSPTSEFAQDIPSACLEYLSALSLH